MTAPKYSRGELARLERSLREIAASTIDGVPLPEPHIEDLEHTADFLAETVGTLDKLAKRRRRRSSK